MTYAEATSFWLALPESEKQRFYSIAAKESSDHTAFEWFNHLVPDELKDDPAQIEVFMDGGTVVSEQVLHELPDRDVSRIESGHNGGDYTTDNTIMENSSVNRARGADNMSPEELDVAQADNTNAVNLLEQGEIISPDTTLVDGIDTSLTEELLGGALEAVVPAIFSAKAAMYVSDHFDTTEDKIGYGALSAGGTTLLFVNPVTGPLAWAGAGIYSAFKLAQLGCRVYGKLANS